MPAGKQADAGASWFIDSNPTGAALSKKHERDRRQCFDRVKQAGVETLIRTAILSFGAIVALAACSPTPDQQAALRCGASTAGGAAVGAGLGSLVGGGSGRNVAMTAGAIGGGVAGNRMGC